MPIFACTMALSDVESISLGAIYDADYIILRALNLTRYLRRRKRFPISNSMSARLCARNIAVYYVKYGIALAKLRCVSRSPLNWRSSGMYKVILKFKIEV